MKERSPIQRGFEHLEGMNCFVCAPRRLNPMGLDLVFEETAEGARTEFLLPEVFQSYPGYLHGGILSAILDETMAYAGVFKRHVLPFTRKLTTQFRAGVRADAPHVCLSVLGGGDDGGFEATALILDDRGRTLVSAAGEFSIPSVAMAKRMLGEKGVEEFQSFFRA